MSVAGATTAVEGGLTLATACGRFGFTFPPACDKTGSVYGCVVGRARTARCSQKVSQAWQIPSKQDPSRAGTNSSWRSRAREKSAGAIVRVCLSVGDSREAQRKEGFGVPVEE